MTGRTNASHGGGNSAGTAYAAIVVASPLGSSIIATNGNGVIQQKNISGKCLIGIQEGGSWKVSASNGTNRAEENVEVDKAHNIYQIYVAWKEYFYNQGYRCFDITGGWGCSALSQNGETVGKVQLTNDYIYFDYSQSNIASGEAIAYTLKKVSFAGYRKVVINFSFVRQFDGYFIVGTIDDLNKDQRALSNMAWYKMYSWSNMTSFITGTKDLEIPIEGLETNYFVIHGVNFAGIINSVWLE